MGFPLSSVIAEWETRKLEENIIKDHKNEIGAWIRYFDNIFIIITNKANLTALLNEINLYGKNIQFTIEKEIN